MTTKKKSDIKKSDIYIIDIALALYKYEVDEPHFDEDNPYYPNITPESFLRMLGSEHSGDCTNQAHACVRCFTEEIWHKANYIHQQLFEKDLLEEKCQ